MTGQEIRLPADRPRPRGWDPPPTTPARSWAELVETLQGGLAVIDNDWRLGFVSERFLPDLGTPEELVGLDLCQLLPSLAEDDPRQLRQRVDQGHRVEFEQPFLRTDEDHRWYRVTVTPSPGLGDNIAAVVFAADITASGRPLAQLRAATVELTNVESELHRRVGRDVHDGPIQLLAALMFRLGMSDTAETNELQRIVSDVAAMLRDVIAAFSPEPGPAEGRQIEQWIAPLLTDSGIEVAVEDRRSNRWDPDTTQAAFVLIYQVVSGVKQDDDPRTVRVELSDENGGERTLVSFPSAAGRSTTTGRTGLQYRTIARHARSLGGTLSTWLDEAEVRWVSMWIPKLTSPLPEPPAIPATPPESQESAAVNHLSLLPPLDDATWQDLARAAPERLVEFDESMRISFSNAVQQELIGASPEELIGLPMDAMFPVESLSQLDSAFERLAAGEFVETEWSRSNSMGDSRLVHITVSPRLDAEGRFLGVLVASDDRTEGDLLEGLYHTALADLTQARRLAIERSIRFLEEPLAECWLLIDRLRRTAATLSQRASVLTIADELEAALHRIEGSASALIAPRISVDELGDRLRESLGTLLFGRRLVVADQTDRPVSGENLDVIFSISREAANNAVLHGQAGLIAITLTNNGDGVTCEVHDTGVGVDPDRLRHREGHLGIRAMRERARERGGDCRIERDPRGGTVVSLWLPDPVDQPSRSAD